MVHMTDQDMKNINGIWNKVEPEVVGPETLGRLLIVNPSTQKYFTDLGDLSSADAINHNAEVKTHGEKLVRSIGEGFKKMDNLDEYTAKLSQDDSETLNKYSNVLRIFGRMLVIILDKHLHEEFTPEVKGSFEKALGAMADALGKSSH